MRAKPLEPSEWKRKLKDLTDDDEASPSNSGKSYILLDVRNGIYFAFSLSIVTEQS